ncbi:MAG: hypothetical protein CMH64_04535 [Nanoarchaeota archaeon]|nr:hypothetical protein [Nanoarchaeota archaeon]|tara:strand:- start:4843 stop:5100 length:258 start_codon:yes stop_codon:yes gene_type:complete
MDYEPYMLGFVRGLSKEEVLSEYYYIDEKIVVSKEGSIETVGLDKKLRVSSVKLGRDSSCATIEIVVCDSEDKVEFTGRVECSFN